MKSWQVLRDAADRIGVKALASKLRLSTALVYKWCQESPESDPLGSGALNPLDRVQAIYNATQDEALIAWLCQQADGFFVKNPRPTPDRERSDQLLVATQKVVNEFGQLLATVSRSFENDGQITEPEAEQIRSAWERLKSCGETFVVACERGFHRKK